MAAGDVIATNVCSLESRQGASFDGTDDYILADAHAVARVAANDTTGTYSAWIFPDILPDSTSVTILSAGDNDSANEFFNIGTYGDKLATGLKQGGAVQFVVRQTTGTLTAKKWNHIALVQNGIQPSLFVNGLRVAGTNSTATDLTMWYDELTGCDKFAIGVLESNNTHTEDFAGMISDVKYWNRALTDEEVLADYKGEALTGDGTYLQLHLLKGRFGVTDQGLGADNGTLTGGAYLHGWGSEWSRAIDLSGAVVADNITTVYVNDGAKRGAISAIVKAA